MTIPKRLEYVTQSRQKQLCPFYRHPSFRETRKANTFKFKKAVSGVIHLRRRDANGGERRQSIRRFLDTRGCSSK